MTVWVPGKLENPKNGSHKHWATHSKAVKARREKAQMCILHAIRPGVREWPRPPIVATAPKIITFRCYVHSLFDDDSLPLTCAAYRDALIDMRIVQNDDPRSGHTFIYEQKMSRGKDAKRGVEITIEAQ